jgi:adenylylsulfate kinase-like enzyme
VVILISGPIASGKSALAKAVAQELQRRGRSAATIDLDIVYDMLEPNTGSKDDAASWLRARRAAAALTDEFFAQGMETVIVDGPFFTPEERDSYARYLRTEAELRCVTLTVSLEEAARRAEKDATRTVSRQREFLKRHHAAAQNALRGTPPTDLLLDTERLSPGEAARVIVGWTEGGES